jgi:hypothetical protein
MTQAACRKWWYASVATWRKKPRVCNSESRRQSARTAADRIFADGFEQGEPRAESSLGAERDHRVRSRGAADRDEQRDRRATHQDGDGAAERDRVEGRHAVDQVA